MSNQNIIVGPSASSAWNAVTHVVNPGPKVDVENRGERGSTMDLAEFNALAGVKPRGHAHHNPVTLLQRLMQLRAGRVPLRRISDDLHLGGLDVSEDLHAAGMGVLEALHKGERSALEDRLDDTYDPLERYSLLRYVHAKIDESDFSHAEKERLKHDLDGMLDDLMGRHGEAIRAGLKNKDAFESALGKMDALSAGSSAEHHPGSLAELRALYGSRSDGKTEMGLTPMGLAKSLMDRFGAGNFISALGGLRSKMASEFRTRPAAQPGPRLWLSLADAASFNTVQTSFALAGDLRRTLSESAKVVSKAGQAETALALLGATEPGRGRAEPVVGQIADSKALTPLQQMQLYRLTRLALEKMPMTAWPKDTPAQRMNLLDELRVLAAIVCDKMPRAATPAEQLEQKMRDKVQRKGESDQDESGRERDEPQSDEDDPALVGRKGGAWSSF